jgi:hypothetical protein
MVRPQLLLAAALLVAAPVAAQESAPAHGGLVICYPNAPGNQRVAAPVMERLGQYLSRKVDAPLRPAYFNEVDPARIYVETQRPAFGILSLAMFLRWRKEHGLKVIALSERLGQTSDRFHLLVKQDAKAKSLADLGKSSPATLWSSHLDDMRFATNVVFAGALALHADGSGPVRLRSTRQPLRALRRMKAGKPFEGKPVDAVLVDGTTWNGLQKLKTFRGVLRVLYTSPALPSPPVVAFRGVAPERGKKLAEVLAGMRKNDEGQRILKTLQTTGFQAADAKAIDAVVAAYAREVPQ